VIRRFLLAALGQQPLFALEQSGANIIGRQPQVVADVLKRKGRVVITLQYPLLRFVEKMFILAMPGEDIFTETFDGVLQYRQHQLPFRFHGQSPLERIEIFDRG